MNAAMWLVVLTSTQEEPVPREARPIIEERKEKGFALGLLGRVEIPSGDVSDDGLSYSDLFHTGFGLAAEGEYSLNSGSDWLRISAYASLGFDRFQGDRFTDDVGDSVRPEALDRLTLLVGPKLVFLIDEPVFSGHLIFFEVRAGAGLARYASVDAEFVVGGVRSTHDFFDAGVKSAFEVALRVGISSETLSFGIGLGIWSVGGPDPGSDLSSGVDPDRMSGFMIELGYELRFCPPEILRGGLTPSRVAQ